MIKAKEIAEEIRESFRQVGKSDMEVTIIRVFDKVTLEVGKEYDLKGKILNGYKTNAEGKRVPYICDEHVTRKVTKITKDMVYCICGREFFKEGLTVGMILENECGYKEHTYVEVA